MPDFFVGSVTGERQCAAVVVRLRGEIDITLRDDANRAVAVALGSGLPVVLDLGGVRLLGATGVALVVACVRGCAQAGTSCVLRGVPDNVRSLLEALDLEPVLGGRVSA